MWPEALKHIHPLQIRCFSHTPLSPHLFTLYTELFHFIIQMLKYSMQYNFSIKQELIAMKNKDCHTATKASAFTVRPKQGSTFIPHGKTKVFIGSLTEPPHTQACWLETTGTDRLSSVKPVTHLMLVLIPCRVFVYCFSFNWLSICQSGPERPEAQRRNIKCVNCAWHSYSTGYSGNSSNFFCISHMGAQQHLTLPLFLEASCSSRALLGGCQAASLSGGTCRRAAVELPVL